MLVCVMVVVESLANFVSGFFFFFFNDTATTEIYTLSLHDALPISPSRHLWPDGPPRRGARTVARGDRKSTRLNSSHGSISYAVFCLKKKKIYTLPFVFMNIHIVYRLCQIFLTSR